MDNAITLDHFVDGDRARIVRIEPRDEADPYPAMADRLGVTIGVVLLACGYDDERKVYLFEDKQLDRRFGLPVETCRRVWAEQV